MPITKDLKGNADLFKESGLFPKETKYEKVPLPSVDPRTGEQLYAKGKTRITFDDEATAQAFLDNLKKAPMVLDVDGKLSTTNDQFVLTEKQYADLANSVSADGFNYGNEFTEAQVKILDGKLFATGSQIAEAWANGKFKAANEYIAGHVFRVFDKDRKPKTKDFVDVIDRKTEQEVAEELEKAKKAGDGMGGAGAESQAAIDLFRKNIAIQYQDLGNGLRGTPYGKLRALSEQDSEGNHYVYKILLTHPKTGVTTFYTENTADPITQKFSDLGTTQLGKVKPGLFEIPKNYRAPTPDEFKKFMEAHPEYFNDGKKGAEGLVDSRFRVSATTKGEAFPLVIVPTPIESCNEMFAGYYTIPYNLTLLEAHELASKFDIKIWSADKSSDICTAYDDATLVPVEGKKFYRLRLSEKILKNLAEQIEKQIADTKGDDVRLTPDWIVKKEDAKKLAEALKNATLKRVINQTEEAAFGRMFAIISTIIGTLTGLGGILYMVSKQLKQSKAQQERAEKFQKALTKEMADMQAHASSAKGYNPDNYTNNLVAQARLQPTRDRMVGNIINEVVDHIIDTLASNKTPNAVIRGKAGAGKSEILMELARRIAEGNIDDSLKNAIILDVNYDIIMAGGTLRGGSEGGLNSVIELAMTGKTLGELCKKAMAGDVTSLQGVHDLAKSKAEYKGSLYAELQKFTADYEAATDAAGKQAVEQAFLTKYDGFRIIPFFDEAHRLAGMGASSESKSDMLEQLKRPMSNGSMETIMATTDNETVEMDPFTGKPKPREIDKLLADPAVARRIRQIRIPDYSRDLLLEIAQAKKAFFEAERGVTFKPGMLDTIVDTAVELSLDRSADGGAAQSIINKLMDSLSNTAQRLKRTGKGDGSIGPEAIAPYLAALQEDRKPNYAKKIPELKTTIKGLLKQLVEHFELVDGNDAPVTVTLDAAALEPLRATEPKGDQFARLTRIKQELEKVISVYKNEGRSVPTPEEKWEALTHLMALLERQGRDEKELKKPSDPDKDPDPTKKAGEPDKTEPVAKAAPAVQAEPATAKTPSDLGPQLAKFFEIYRGDLIMGRGGKVLEKLAAAKTLEEVMELLETKAQGKIGADKDSLNDILTALKPAGLTQSERALALIQIILTGQDPQLSVLDKQDKMIDRLFAAKAEHHTLREALAEYFDAVLAPQTLEAYLQNVDVARMSDDKTALEYLRGLAARLSVSDQDIDRGAEALIDRDTARLDKKAAELAQHQGYSWTTLDPASQDVFRKEAKATLLKTAILDQKLMNLTGGNKPSEMAAHYIRLIVLNQTGQTTRPGEIQADGQTMVDSFVKAIKHLGRYTSPEDEAKVREEAAAAKQKTEIPTIEAMKADKELLKTAYKKAMRKLFTVAKFKPATTTELDALISTRSETLKTHYEKENGKRPTVSEGAALARHILANDVLLSDKWRKAIGAMISELQQEHMDSVPDSAVNANRVSGNTYASTLQTRLGKLIGQTPKPDGDGPGGGETLAATDAAADQNTKPVDELAARREAIRARQDQTGADGSAARKPNASRRRLSLPPRHPLVVQGLVSSVVKTAKEVAATGKTFAGSALRWMSTAQGMLEIKQVVRPMNFEAFMDSIGLNKAERAYIKPGDLLRSLRLHLEGMEASPYPGLVEEIRLLEAFARANSMKIGNSDELARQAITARYTVEQKGPRPSLDRVLHAYTAQTRRDREAARETMRAVRPDAARRAIEREHEREILRGRERMEKVGK